MGCNKSKQAGGGDVPGKQGRRAVQAGDLSAALQEANAISTTQNWKNGESSKSGGSFNAQRTDEELIKRGQQVTPEQLKELLNDPRIQSIIAASPEKLVIVNECLADPAAVTKYTNHPDMQEIVAIAQSIMGGAAPPSEAQVTCTYLFAGSPGTCKSSTANNYAGCHMFQSGTSICGVGVSKGLDVRHHNGKCFKDTPGFNDPDPEIRAAASNAVTDSLNVGGTHVILFFCKTDDGRVRPEDKSFLKMVLESCPQIKQYGIVVSQCKKNWLKKMTKQGGWDQFLATFWRGMEALVTPNVFFYEVHSDLDDMDDELLPVERRDELRGYCHNLKKFITLQDFIDENVVPVNLTPGQATVIDCSTFDDIKADNEKKDKEHKALLKASVEERKKATEQIQKLNERAQQDRDEAARAMKELKENQKKINEKYTKQLEENQPEVIYVDRGVCSIM